MKGAFEVFYDGACPLCRREIAFLRRRDHQERIRFTDIASPDFDASTIGRTRAELMARIHGRTAEGKLVEGVEVFRQLYAAVGFRTLASLTRIRPFAWILEHAYRWFAKNRLRLTRRAPCSDSSCAVGAP